MYHADFLRHFQAPVGQGALPDATHGGEAEDAACGDRLALDLRIRGGRIEAVRFRVQGCAGAIAVGSALATLLPGRVASPGAVSAKEIEGELGEIPRAKRHALRLARTVLERALPGG